MTLDGLHQRYAMNNNTTMAVNELVDMSQVHLLENSVEQCSTIAVVDGGGGDTTYDVEDNDVSSSKKAKVPDVAAPSPSPAPAPPTSFSLFDMLDAQKGAFALPPRIMAYQIIEAYEREQNNGTTQNDDGKSTLELLENADDVEDLSPDPESWEEVRQILYNGLISISNNNSDDEAFRYLKVHKALHDKCRGNNALSTQLWGLVQNMVGSLLLFSQQIDVPFSSCALSNLPSKEGTYYKKRGMAVNDFPHVEQEVTPPPKGDALLAMMKGKGRKVPQGIDLDFSSVKSCSGEVAATICDQVNQKVKSTLAADHTYRNTMDLCWDIVQSLLTVLSNMAVDYVTSCVGNEFEIERMVLGICMILSNDYLACIMGMMEPMADTFEVWSRFVDPPKFISIINASGLGGVALRRCESLGKNVSSESIWNTQKIGSNTSSLADIEHCNFVQSLSVLRTILFRCGGSREIVSLVGHQFTTKVTNDETTIDLSSFLLPNGVVSIDDVQTLLKNSEGTLKQQSQCMEAASDDGIKSELLKPFREVLQREIKDGNEVDSDLKLLCTQTIQLLQQ